jgi:hypothetical protein
MDDSRSASERGRDERTELDVHNDEALKGGVHARVARGWGPRAVADRTRKSLQGRRTLPYALVASHTGHNRRPALDAS